MMTKSVSCLALVLVLLGASIFAFGAEKGFSIRICVYIPAIQELSISTNYPASVIRVGNLDTNEVYSSVSLAPPKVDLNKEWVELPEAVTLHVFSNINWRVMALIESLEVDYIGGETAPTLGVMLRIADSPPGVIGPRMYQQLPCNASVEIARGEPLQKSFSLDYLFQLKREGDQTIRNVNVDLVYVLLGL